MARSTWRTEEWVDEINRAMKQGPSQETGDEPRGGAGGTTRNGP